MNPATPARLILSCLLALSAVLPAAAQTITRLTDQVLQIHRSSSPDQFINLGPDKVLFMAAPASSGERIPHVTDGTTAGTKPLIGSLPAGTTATGSFHLLGAHAYFFMRAPEGTESSLWKTDGTPGGTTLVSSGAPAELHSLAIVNGRIIGTAYGSVQSTLWATNGTPQGTGTIFTPPAGSSIDSGTAVNGTYFFSLIVTTPEGRRDAIWKSDGTASGTVALKTLAHTSGGSTVYDQSPGQAAFLNGHVYFLAQEDFYDPTYGEYIQRTSLWKTDGTPSGTLRVGNFDALYHRMHAFGGSLFLEKNGAVDWAGSVTPPRILRSDGTIAGSSTVFHGTSPRTYTGLQRMGEHGGRVYYNATHYNIMYPASPRYSDLHRMSPDGSFEALGTLPTGWNFSTGDQLSYAYGIVAKPSGFYVGIYGGTTDIWKISGASPATIERLGSGAVASAAEIGGFMIGPGNNFTAGNEVYSNQGGLTLIADLSPGIESTDAAYSGFQAGERATLGNLLLYTGQDPAAGAELWRSDGTPAGTFRLQDISSGAVSSAITRIIPAEGFAWFIVRRGDISPAFTVDELWKTDGTAAGTTFVRRCPESDYWNQMAADNQRLVVKKQPVNGVGDSLEILDGPGAGRVLTSDSGSLGPVFVSGGWIWWQETGATGAPLKRSDGSAAPAQSVALPANHTLVTLDAKFGDGVLATTYDSSHFHLVWIRGSTSIILHSRAGYGYFSAFREHNGRLYFIDGDSLHSSDGTAGSSVLLHTGQIADAFVSHGGSLYFISRASYESPRQIWKTAGTPASTSVTPIQPPPGYSDIVMISNGGWLLYSYETYDSSSGEFLQQVRRSSGLADGEIIPGMTSGDLSFHSLQSNLKPLPSGTVFFNRFTAQDGDELYKLELPAAPPTTPFGIWAQNNGLAGTDALPDGDADRDGVKNIVEYYTGSLPGNASSSFKPAFSTVNPAGTTVRIIPFRRMPDTGLTMTLESSVDLVQWNTDVTLSPDGTHIYNPTFKRTVIYERTGSSPETITFAVLPANTYPKVFIRFRVTE